MSLRLEYLALRKEVLIARAALQRYEIAQQMGWLARPASAVGGAIDMVRWLRSHPVLAVGFAALGVGAARGRIARWSGGILALWQAWRVVRAVLHLAFLRA